MTDLEIILEYLSRQWLPVPVKEAYDRLQSYEAKAASLRDELAHLKSRMTPSGAFF